MKSTSCGNTDTAINSAFNGDEKQWREKELTKKSL